MTIVVSFLWRLDIIIAKRRKKCNSSRSRWASSPHPPVFVFYEPNNEFQGQKFQFVRNILSFYASIKGGGYTYVTNIALTGSTMVNCVVYGTGTKNATPLRHPFSFQKHYHLTHILTTQINGRWHKTYIRQWTNQKQETELPWRYKSLWILQLKSSLNHEITQYISFITLY